MYLSLNWLKEYVKFTQTPEQVADILTQGGFEVENIIRYGNDFDNVVIGQIKTIVNHAEANKLSVCKVDVGKKQLLNIVCGANNIKPGQRVPVAVIGAKLPNGLTIERRKIRGIDSEGMICAEDELGLGKEHSGIMILDDKLRIGANFGLATGLKDVVLDLSLTPNRPDSYSVIGLAREFAALSGQKFIAPKLKLEESTKYSTKKLITVAVKDKKLCPKYIARVVKSVKVAPSPQWLQARLTLSGIKPINNIVDISNFVMLETGQPLHAFDLANIKGNKINIRKAGNENKFTTLDGLERNLDKGMLMIADSSKSLAIAGVMGGQNSEISKITKDVVIESAIFDSYSIRQTRHKLGLVTEASTRFEKGLYRESPELASDRAAQMMADIASGVVAKDMVIMGDNKKVLPQTLDISLDYINKIIGRKFTVKEVTDILGKLYFNVTTKDNKNFKIVVPFFRTDVAQPADIVEEIGRMYGWAKLKSANIYAELKPVTLPKPKRLQRMIQDILVGTGLTEVYNYSFYSEAMAKKSGIDINNHYLVTNPVSEDQKYMRTSLLPGLINNVLKYHKDKDQIKLFEFGHVYFKGSGEPVEDNHLAIIFYQKSKGDIMTDLHQTMGLIFRQLNISENRIEYKANRGNSYNILVDKQPIGVYGWASKAGNKVGLAPLYLEFDFNSLIDLAVEKVVYKKINDYPDVEHDLTFLTPTELDYNDIIRTVKSLDKRITKFYSAKSLYNQSEDTCSATFKVVFQASDHTLSAEEIEDMRHKIIHELKNKYKMELKK
ncbi:MAG: phenylalanine--tRNA ligase subunit beta [bacterium]|nr:phenylalanine--tRNA ligase subunit beta [bacterium]